MYRLKKGIEEFQVVDGPLAGRKFRRGREYKEIPPGQEHKFEEITEEVSRKGAKGAKE